MRNPLFCLTIVLVIGLNACLSSKRFSLENEIEQNDYLVYYLEQDSDLQRLMLYDPANNKHTEILSNWAIDEFSLSTNNRLAFSSSQNGNSSIYVLEYPFTGNTPVEITLDKSSINISPSWSPDGRYLLFDSVQGDSKKLFLWDGKNFSNIYTHQGKISEITWSDKGELAFTEFFINDPSPDKDSGEVYIWDGNVTVSASQNPSGDDRFPAWSKEGQLAFLSEQNGEHDILIWDSISKDNGAPDAKTFVNIAPKLTQYFSIPTWTNTNSIAFTAGSESGVHVQIYEWDGQSAKNISQNPAFHNGGQTWRNDGYWSFITFFSSGQYLYIRNNSNQTVLETKGQYQPAWSQTGLLVFCVPEHPDWTLSMWNGKNVVEIAHGDFIVAKWNNGEVVFCSNG